MLKVKQYTLTDLEMSLILMSLKMYKVELQKIYLELNDEHLKCDASYKVHLIDCLLQNLEIERCV